jgi:hypothetical protein
MKTNRSMVLAALFALSIYAVPQVFGHGGGGAGAGGWGCFRSQDETDRA